MNDRKFHPAADIFPMLADEDLQALAEDIMAHGLQAPIELLDGKIIDGRNRYRACRIVRVTPRMVRVTTKDPVAYVLSRNLHRRHLDTSQRAMVAARAREYYDQRAKERQIRKPTDSVVEIFPPQKGKSRDQAGKAVGISGRTVDAARQVLAKGTPELIRAVDEGRLSVSAAAKTVEKPEIAGTPQDADGVTIPPALRPIFAVQAEFDSLARSISILRGQIEDAVEGNPDAFSALEHQKIVAELSSMRQQFLEAKPYLICPACGGEDPQKTCNLCGGREWLSRFRSRTVPIEMRNPQRKAHELELLTGASQRAGEVTRP